MWIWLLFSVCLRSVQTSRWTDLELAPKLLEYHIRSDDKLRESCLKDPTCPVKRGQLENGRCWGMERNCDLNSTYTHEMGIGKCNLRTHKRPIQKNAKETFFEEADFGYVKSRSFLHTICDSKDETKTTLECSDHLRYCYAKNIFFDFRHFNVKRSARYRNDLIKDGDVGGSCEQFFPEVIKSNMGHKSYLQSWAHELEFFQSNPEFEVNSAHCDVIFERPTIVVKLDASVNMFHHFCDFVNIYASQHLNSSFSRDVDIVWWDTHSGGFVDNLFGTTWRAFSNRKPVELVALAGKRVCFKQAMLPLLARQRYGLYYNMPLMEGCSGSGLMHSFSHHLLHRLEVAQEGPLLDKIRVTILTRSTRYRKILNINELLAVTKEIPELDVKLVDYNHNVPFLSQLAITQNSDIFVGMHGSGLTHLLFLPDWAAIFEIYNCDDRSCYYDLARLRGVKYFTWPVEKLDLISPDGDGIHPSSGKPHKKFANYSFDPVEFKRNLQKMVDYVRRHPKFTEHRRRLRRSRAQEEL